LHNFLTSLQVKSNLSIYSYGPKHIAQFNQPNLK
jgi:hypothetical protein